jgi:hypothetical protein
MHHHMRDQRSFRPPADVSWQKVYNVYHDIFPNTQNKDAGPQNALKP